MAFSYESALKRTCGRCFSFKTDSFWSWLLAGVAFLNKLINIGVMFALGAFFDSWREEFGGPGTVSQNSVVECHLDFGLKQVPRGYIRCDYCNVTHCYC